jgi:cell division protein FtsB
MAGFFVRGRMVGMKLVVSRAKRRRLQFSLRFLLAAFTLLALTGAAVTWIRAANQREMAKAQRDYAQQMRDNLNRQMILRTTENIEYIPWAHRQKK